MKVSSLLKTFLLVLVDSVFCWLSWMGSIFVFSYLLRVDYTLMGIVNRQVWIVLLACALFYTICGVYRSLWQHPGLGSLIRLLAAVFFSSFTVYVSLRARMGYWSNPGLGMMAFYFLLTLSLIVRSYRRVWVAVMRYAKRFIGLPSILPQEPVRTLLVGAGESASAFLLHKSQQGERPRAILCIVDKDTRKHGYHLHGVSIYGGVDMIPQLVRRFDIDEIVVAVPSIKNDELRRIVKLTPVNRCKVRLLSALSTDKASDMLRELNIGDLLGRPETAMDSDAVGAWLKGKTVLITGGGGSIGGELCRSLFRFDVGKIILFDISENNAYNLKEELKVKHKERGRQVLVVRIGSIQDKDRLDEVFSEFKPSIVFHAAAYKHVPLMEECPRLAMANNVVGTYLVADCAIRHGVERFVMISTDKAVNPTNVMGATKRLAEMLVLGMGAGATTGHKAGSTPDKPADSGERDAGDGRKAATEFVCVRFGNVLDSSGSVIPLFKRQIEAGGPVTVTHPEIIRYFMTIPEAARLVLEAGAMAAGGEIFILDMGEPVKIADLAESLIRMAGLTPDVDIKIEYIGLRPGEKLYEELLLNEEGLARTINDKIFVVKPEPSPLLPELAEIVENWPMDSGDVRGIIKRFVPEYHVEG